MGDRVHKIKKFIKENLVEIIILIVFIVLVKIPVNYYIITGGGTIKTNPRVIIDNEYKNKGTFNMCYVSEINGNLLTYLLSFPLRYDRESTSLSKASYNETVEDIEFRNELWLNSANNDAAVAAYNALNKDVKVKSKKIYILAKLSEAKSDLKVGDELISIDGVEGKTLDDFRKIINSKNDGDKINIKVKHDGKEYQRYATITDEKGKKYIGVELMESVSYEFDPKIKFNFKSNEGGPSGGLMLSLEIYNELTKQDITHGLNIAGTGTIDSDGNVGEIDGVKYKIRGAEHDHMDVFLAPSGRNYREALKNKKEYNLKIKVIEVKNLNDALEKLKELK